MSETAILHIENSKKGKTFIAILENNKRLPMQHPENFFNTQTAEQGDVLHFHREKGAFVSCSIPGKEADPAAQKTKQTAKHDSYQSYPPQNLQNRANTGGGAHNTKPLTDATAPYNFIPYVHEAVLPPFPTDDTTERWSGTIRCSLTALTPLLVAGPQVKEKDGNRTAPRCFLKVNGKPVIPGSSLKGLIRSVVEVLSFSYMRPMNDKPLFWRLVNRPEYRSRFDELKPDDKNAVLKGGYLRKQGADYSLIPVDVHRLLTENTAGKERFRTGQIETYHPKTRVKGVSCDYVFDVPTANPQNVEREVVTTFMQQLTVNQKKRWTDMADRLNGKKHGLPVFTLYDKAGNIAEIGLCRYFRLKYKHCPADLVVHDDNPDFASHLFGTVKGESRKGKVAFASAVVQGTEDDVYKTVLGQPSATCLTHYVHQPLDVVRLYKTSTNKNDPESFISYTDDSPKLQLRGRKWYWHRDKKDVPQLLNVPQPLNDNKNVYTLLKPLKEGATADFTIRVDNVTALELGALLTALELPEDHAHKLGLGKSLGFGSVRISIESASVHFTEQRYTSLAARCAGSRPTPLTAEHMQSLRESFKKAIATEVQKRHGDWKNLDYETLPPIKALRRMMNYEHRPENEITNPMSLKNFNRKAILLPVDDMIRQRQGA